MESLFSSFDNVPTFTVKLLDASNYIRSNIWMLLGIVAVFILVVVIFLRTKIGKKFTDRLGLSFPIVKNLTKKTILASFCRTLAVLLGSGIPISKSLKISTETIENYLYVEMIEDVYKNLNKGQALAVSFKKYEKYFPPTLIKLIEAGEKTGTLEDNLMYLYDYYASEVDDMASNLTNLLEPILLVFIGAMIGLLAITIIAPVYQLTSSINQ
jgi:type IV pilus assembly protein PilC